MQGVTTAVTSWACWSCRVWKTLVCSCPSNLWLFWSFHTSFCDSPWLWGGLWQWCPTYSQLSTALTFMLNTWTSYEFLREPPSTVQRSLCTEDWGWRCGHGEMNLDDSLLLYPFNRVTVVSLPQICEGPNPGLSAGFTVPSMLLQVECASDSIRKHFPHNIHNTVAFLNLSCHAGPCCSSPGSQFGKTMTSPSSLPCTFQDCES